MQALEIRHPHSTDLAPYIGHPARYSYIDEPEAAPSHYGTIIQNIADCDGEECIYHAKDDTCTYTGIIDTIQILLL